MTIRSKLSIIPYFVIGSIVYFQFHLQQAYDKKLSKKLEVFNTTELQLIVANQEVKAEPIDQVKEEVFEILTANTFIYIRN